MSTKLYSAAKINLLLDLGQTLDNGYHEIYTIMQSVSLYDEITVTKTGNDIKLDSDFDLMPLDSRNTAYKAAELFFEKTGFSGGADIYIQKNIPMQAGMAGGSADAAGVLRALNTEYNAGLSERELCEIAGKIGADVPFCVVGGTMLSQNIGEVLAPLKPCPNCYFVIVKPQSSVSTKAAYKAYDESDSVRHPSREWLLSQYCFGNMKSFWENTMNVFEQFVLIPERAEIKSILRRSGAVCEQMSGSGSAVFGVFNSKEKAESAYKALKKNFGRVYICEPVTKSITDEI